jgi:uncharacterized protein YjbI with pentapeptide repeats
MVFQEKATQTEEFKKQYRKYCGLTSKNVLQFASSLILPLMLGIFTVVITFQQQTLARQQRLEDKVESRLQRDDDRKELHEQRQQDWNISQTAQAIQNKVVIDQYRDEVLVAYIKEIGDLLEKKNGSLTSHSLTHTLARVKTLNTIRQLDGSRQIHVIRFLCEAGQLINTNESTALDISTAELTDIDFRKTGRLLTNTKISLAGVYLVNSTFSNMDLLNVNFSFATLDNVNFSSSKWVHNVNFSSAQLYDVNFASAAWLANVDFSSAGLHNVDFSSVGLYDVNFSSSQLENVDFSSAGLHNVDFSSVGLYDVNFSSSQLENVNFASAKHLDNINFSSAQLNNVEFSSVALDNVDFSSARLVNVNFSSAQLYDVNFSSARLDHVNFLSARFGNIH